MTTWNDALEGTAARRDADTVKAVLPLEWVLEQHGFAFSADPAGRLVSRCRMPNHPGVDENGSFAVYSSAGDSRVYCGCWSCDFNQGDVFDFLVAWYPEINSFSSALTRASVLLDEFLTAHNGDPSSYRRRLETTGRSPEEQKLYTRTFTQVCLSALQEASDPATRQPSIDLLIREKISDDVVGWERLTADYLVERWRLGTSAVDRYLVYIPHISWDSEAGQLVVKAYKTRTPKSKPFAKTGSELDALYGEWHDVVPDRPVVLLEGESDCWTIDKWLRDRDREEVVLGLPSGASARPKEEWVERLKGRHVTLMFDGDTAGRKATRKWAHALNQAAISYNIVQLDDGRDASTLSDREVGAVLANAEVLQIDQGNIQLSDDGVFAKWVGRGEDAHQIPICDWGFVPQRRLAFPDGTLGFEGIITPTGKEAVLAASDLTSNPRIVSWANEHQQTWHGTAAQAQNILHHLTIQGPLLARGIAAPSVGWHSGSFVWDGGKIGDEYLIYHPAGPRMPDMPVHLQEGPWDIEAVRALLMMNVPEVTTSILAWLAVAPLRSLFDKFPPLGVFAGAGAGKTTLLSTFLSTFTSSEIYSTLSGTTPHAVQVFAGLTNGIPVWFDEYRPGSREDTKIALDQALRDAWGGQASFKGGQGENKSDIHAFQTLAPIIVSGEDTMSERSHAERMVLLRLFRKDRNPAALDYLDSLGPQTGLGHAYITWLVEQNRNNMLPSRFISPRRDRIETNVWVLEQGWSLITEFSRAYGLDLPAVTFEAVKDRAQALADADPLFQALSWAVMSNEQETLGVSASMNGSGNVTVNVPTFVAAIKRSRVFVLPGGVSAIAAKFIEEWNANPADPEARMILPGAYNRLTGADQ